MNSFKQKVHSYYKIMDLSIPVLNEYLINSSREELISWLEWNDPNGVYNDKQSLKEFDNIMSKEEAVEIMKRQILENR